MNDRIRRAVEAYQHAFRRLPKGMNEVKDLHPLIHRLLEDSEMGGLSKQSLYDITWPDPRVPIIGEIKKPGTQQFNPNPRRPKEDWGYIKERNRIQHGDGLAQLHYAMYEQHARLGIFTDGCCLIVYKHRESSFGVGCFKISSAVSRCDFPAQTPLKCDLIEGSVDEAVRLITFLRNAYRKALSKDV